MSMYVCLQEGVENNDFVVDGKRGKNGATNRTKKAAVAVV